MFVFQKFEDVMQKSKKGVILVSFGSVAQSINMPQEVKQVFLETFKKFPDITFLWKYEKDEHKIAEGYENVVTDKWVPQNDLLGIYCTYKKTFSRFGNPIPNDSYHKFYRES